MLSDGPSLALGITSSLATFLYLETKVRWQRLPYELTCAKVISSADLGLISPADRLDVCLEFVLKRKLGNLVSLVVCTMFALWLTHVISGDSFLFEQMAIRSGRKASDYGVFYENWWANPRRYPVTWVCWSMTGVIGVFSSVKTLALNLRVYHSIDRLGSSGVLRISTLLESENGGWSPLLFFLDSVFYSLVISIFSYASLLYFLTPTGVDTVWQTVSLSILVALIVFFVVSFGLGSLYYRFRLRYFHLEAKRKILDELRIGVGSIFPWRRLESLYKAHRIQEKSVAFESRPVKALGRALGVASASISFIVAVLPFIGIR